MKYSTSDMNVAAFLWSSEDINFDGTYKEGHRVFFKFTSESVSDEELQALLLDYSNERTLVEPNKFCEKQTKLRTWLNNAKKS